MLWAGWSGVQTPIRDFSTPNQTVPEAHPASCTIGTGALF